MSKLITSQFFKKYPFSKPIRFWDKKNEQFSIYYQIPGYDCEILIRPAPQIVPNGYNMFGKGYHLMPAELQVDEFSDIELLEEHHTDDYQIYINNLQNHIATFNYENQILDFFKLCDCELKEINNEFQR
jgi:hypothetical protein